MQQMRGDLHMFFALLTGLRLSGLILIEDQERGSSG